MAKLSHFAFSETVKHIVVLACLLALAVGCNAVAGIEPATLDEEASDEPLDLPPDDATGLDGACDVSSRLCNNRCVRSDDPAFGCGKATCAPCDVRHARAACSAGACVVAQCAPGFADCNGDPKDGCEADLSNAATCGACNVACSESSESAGLCAGNSCVRSCPSKAPTRCGSTCTDLVTDPNRCGACGNVCPTPASGTATCSNGVCG
jgi:hypothetical protein